MIAGAEVAPDFLYIPNAASSPAANPSTGINIWSFPTGSAGSAAGTLTVHGEGGAIEQIAAPGTGTINTQLGVRRHVVAFLRTSASTIATIYTYPMPGTGHTSTIVSTLTNTNITTPANVTCNHTVAVFKNVSGTVTQVGATQTPWVVNVGNMTASYVISGTNVLVSVTNAGTNTQDSTAWIDIYET